MLPQKRRKSMKRDLLTLSRCSTPSSGSGTWALTHVWWYIYRHAHVSWHTCVVINHVTWYMCRDTYVTSWITTQSHTCVVINHHPLTLEYSSSWVKTDGPVNTDGHVTWLVPKRSRCVRAAAVAASCGDLRNAQTPKTINSVDVGQCSVWVPR